MNDIFRVTEKYIQEYFGNLIRAVAKKIGLVEQPEFYSPYELLYLMDQLPSHPLIQRMGDFFQKYRNWHKFILEREKDGIISSTVPELNTEHIRLFTEREAALEALLNGLN
jgi:hypothetical protein